MPPYFLFAYSVLLRTYWTVEDGGICQKFLDHRPFQNQGVLKHLGHFEGSFV